uniref:Tubulin polyglutamylase TTLL4 n=1 Tax=Bursaphelenchus xylophilus TaxID=6326 RepID=A0A1I7SQI1_BURXY
MASRVAKRGNVKKKSAASNKERPLVRHSIFPNMPPTIRFYKRETKVADFSVKKPPGRYKSTFRWCHTSLLPNLMKRTLRSSHYELVPEESEWRGYWGKHLHSFQYRTLTYWQKVNHFPGDFHLGRKDRLWLHLCDMARKFDGFGIMPYTYILPRDLPELREYLKSTKKHVILKPPASARGRGIQIVNKIEEVALDTPLIAQHYIESPLVMNGSKFDLRIYVYVSSLDPLKIYIFKDGLARFASVPYCHEQSYNNQYMHLTNFSINKFAEKNGITDGAVELKWRLSRFWKFVKENGKDPKVLWEKIKDVAIRAVISCVESVRKQQAVYCPYPFLNREVFGMDILVDSDYKPWILEMNISPSMQAATDQDVVVKAPLIADLMNMWRMEFVADGDVEAIDLSYRSKPLIEHKTRIHFYKEAEMMEFYHKTGKISPCILTELTDADLRILIEFEEEFKLRGDFDLIYPHNETIANYLKCNEPNYATLLLTAWICLSPEERTKGIQRIQKLAERGAHLAQIRVENEEKEEDASTKTTDSGSV